MFRPDENRSDLLRLGTSYGGWWVPSTVLGPDSVCYCAGVGLDISFDLALIETFGCSVIAFDPTPGSIDWVASLPDLDPRFSFVPVGLGGEAGSARFYSPVDAGHISHSVKNLQRTSTYFDARVQTVSDLMTEFGHERIDLLKLDIEGAEHDTIARVLDDGVLPSVICVEYDQPEPLGWARGTTAKLREAGYQLVKLENFNLTFVHRSAAAA